MQPLFAEDAQALFRAEVSTSSGETSVDELKSLQELLKAVDYMPLAVVLLAYRCAATSECSYSDLLQQWKSYKSEVLQRGLGGSREDSMLACIELSLQSKPMKNVPQARRLLMILSELPDRLPDYQKTMNNLIPNVLWSDAVMALKAVGLAYIQGDTLKMLSPIR